MSKSPIRRIWRFFWRTALVVVGLILLLVILIQLPPVQDYLTGKVERVLEKRLGTDLGIGGIRLKFPKSIAVTNVYLNTPDGDTLLLLNSAVVNVGMWDLFRRQVSIHRVAIDGLMTHVAITDSTSNIAFIMDAFGGDALRDTVVDDGGEWTVRFPSTVLIVKSSDIYYHDDPGGMLFDIGVGHLRAEASAIDLASRKFILDKVDLAGSALDVRLLATSDDDNSSPSRLLLASRRISIRKTKVEVLVDTRSIVADVEEARIQGYSLYAGDTLALNTGDTHLSMPGFAMHLGVPDTVSYFDANHLVLKDVQGDLGSLLYLPDSMDLYIRHFNGIAARGMTVNALQGEVQYLPGIVRSRDIKVSTPHTSWDAAELEFVYNPDSTSNTQDMALLVDGTGQISVTDIAWFAPGLDTMPYLRDHPGAIIEATLNGTADNDAVNFLRLAIEAPGVTCDAELSIDYPYDPERLRVNTRIKQFSCEVGQFVQMIPDSTLPGYIVLPDSFSGSGSLGIDPETLRVDMIVSESRSGMPGPTEVQAKGSVAQYRSEMPQFDLLFDHFSIYDSSVLSYLPPGTIPEGYTLPGHLAGEGMVHGNYDALSLDMRFSLPGDTTRGDVAGMIRNLVSANGLHGELRIKKLVVAPGDVMTVIPDSLLPDSVALPAIAISDGYLAGDINAFQVDLPIETSVGDVHIEGSYQVDSVDLRLDVAGFWPGLLVTSGIRDTLQKLGLTDIDMMVSATGKTSLPRDMQINGLAFLGGGDSLLVLNGEAHDSTGSMTFRLLHPAVQSTGSMTYEYRDFSHHIAGNFLLDSVQMQTLGITTDTLTLHSHITGEMRITDSGAMSGDIVLDNLEMNDNGIVTSVDSVKLNFQAEDRSNTLSLYSSVLDIEMEGYFNPGDIASQFGKVIRSYWRADSSGTVQIADSIDLRLDIQVKRTRPLTSGLIPGLNRLSPFSMTAFFNSVNNDLNIEMDLPMIRYQGVSAEDMEMRVKGDSNALYYSLNWKDIEVNEQVHLGRTRVTGDNSKPGLLSVELTIWDATDHVRHRLNLFIDAFQETFEVLMDEEQMLNFEKWYLPEDNHIAYTGDSIDIHNWSMTAGPQRLMISNETRDDVIFTFSDFEFNTFARLVNNDEDLGSGRINGEVGLDNITGKMGIRSDVTINEFRILSAYLGTLTAQVQPEEQGTYSADITLNGGGNDFALYGTYSVDGQSDLNIDIQSLQLQSVEPFTFGFLDDSEGYITGRVQVDGTYERPEVTGSLKFNNGAFRIAMLGARIRIGNTPFQLNGDRVVLTGMQLYDENDNVAKVDGTVTLRSLTDIDLDIRGTASNFLVLNSTKQDNPLYYGRLAVDAEVAVAGAATSPQVGIQASARENSYLTYVYGLAQSSQIESTQGVVRFVEQYQWNQILQDGAERDTSQSVGRGVDLRMNLELNENIETTVLIDPLTDQKFTGRAVGTLNYHRFPNGSEDVVGRLELTGGTFDAVLSEGFIRRKFDVVPGSSIQFNGDMFNPLINLHIRNNIRTSPKPLVLAMDPGADVGGLSRSQVFYVDLMLQGDLQKTELRADILYPDDVTGNLGTNTVDDALSQLRTDQSRLRTTAFNLLAFQSFSFSLSNSANGQSTLESTALSVLNEAFSQALSTTIASIEIDVGLESYEEGESLAYNSRISLRKTLFDDRLTISVDGVASTEQDEESGTASTYLDNITAEYILNEQGNLRLRIFNDRDHDALLGANVIRYGGRLAFSKDFEKLRFFGKREE